MPAAGNSAENDEYVVDQRSERGEQKQPVREQDGGHDSANVEENLRGQKNAREMNAKVDLIRLEVFDEPAHELGRVDFREDRAHDHYRGHDRDDDGECFLRVVVALLGQESRIDGDECNGGRAAGHNVVQEVGQGKRGNIGVGLRSGAEGEGNVGLAGVADHARERDRAHQQDGRRERRMLVRRPKKTQQFRHEDAMTGIRC